MICMSTSLGKSPTACWFKRFADCLISLSICTKILEKSLVAPYTSRKKGPDIIVKLMFCRHNLVLTNNEFLKLYTDFAPLEANTKINKRKSIMYHDS